MSHSFSFRLISAVLALTFLTTPLSGALAQVGFDPNFILSDAELEDVNSMTRADIQTFLDSKGSFLRSYQAPDEYGTVKYASDIIYEAAQNYRINPKYLLVKLQKEQSLVMDDTPTQKQLDWATGYGVCDSCSMNDPKIQKFRGFGAQIANAAGIMRWYADNKDSKDYIKKKNVPTIISGQQVIPQSWATAYLYTYTPHINGNQNFWRIWNNWFTQLYPSGSLLRSASSTDVWLITNGTKRRFANQAALISRADPRNVVTVSEAELSNYQLGPEIAFANYSVLRTPSRVYLLDHDTLRPFDTPETVGKLGFNPAEILDVTDADLIAYTPGSVITASSTPPQGVIYQITDLNNAYFILRDGVLYPITDKRIVDVNYATLPIEKHVRTELASFTIAGEKPVTFKDGTLVRAEGSNVTYIIENGKKRRIADRETFAALGYQNSNVVTVAENTLFSLPEGDSLFVNASLLSAKNKFLGDSSAPVSDLFKTNLPAYLVAEYPSGRIIAGKNIDTTRPMASLTKLLIAYQAFDDNFRNKTLVSFDPKNFTKSTTPNLRSKETFTRLDALNGALVASNNTMSEMLALSSGQTKDEFLSAIQTRLNEWGADNTNVKDLSGLSAGNVSTARDLLKIFTKVTAEPSLKKILGKSTYEFTTTYQNKAVKQKLQTTNQLLTAKSSAFTVIAGKTGFTTEAQANLILLIEAPKTKQQYVIITLGNTSTKRFDEPRRIAEWIAKGGASVNATLAQN